MPVQNPSHDAPCLIFSHNPLTTKQYKSLSFIRWFFTPYLPTTAIINLPHCRYTSLLKRSLGVSNSCISLHLVPKPGKEKPLLEGLSSLSNLLPIWDLRPAVLRALFLQLLPCQTFLGILDWISLPISHPSSFFFLAFVPTSIKSEREAYPVCHTFKLQHWSQKALPGRLLPYGVWLTAEIPDLIIHSHFTTLGPDWRCPSRDPAISLSMYSNGKPSIFYSPIISSDLFFTKHKTSLSLSCYEAQTPVFCNTERPHYQLDNSSWWLGNHSHCFKAQGCLRTPEDVTLLV